MNYNEEYDYSYDDEYDELYEDFNETDQHSRGVIHSIIAFVVMVLILGFSAFVVYRIYQGDG